MDANYGKTLCAGRPTSFGHSNSCRIDLSAVSAKMLGLADKLETEARRVITVIGREEDCGKTRRVDEILRLSAL